MLKLPAARPSAGLRHPARRQGAALAASLKIAFAYVGPVATAAGPLPDNGRKAVEKEFGDKVVTSFVEKVPEAADAERVIRDMVGQGNKLIFGTTFGYMEPMLKVAPTAKDVKFEHATGYKTAEHAHLRQPHLRRRLHGRRDRQRSMTKTNTLGVVGSIPIPEVIRNINSFTWARRAEPEDQDQGGVGQRGGSTRRRNRSRDRLINGGADVLMQNTDSPAVLQDRREESLCFGWDQRHDRLRP